MRYNKNDVETEARENKKFMNSNQMLPDIPTPRHDGTEKQRTNQRTNYLSRMVYALNEDEEREVGHVNLPNWLRVIAVKMELSRT